MRSRHLLLTLALAALTFWSAPLHAAPTDQKSPAGSPRPRSRANLSHSVAIVSRPTRPGSALSSASHAPADGSCPDGPSPASASNAAAAWSG